ncbi:MAG: antibiotic biosynthesis monooxygenase family protein [Gammaproteobacteria bacterium]
MIREIAILNIIPGREAEFEQAFDEAREIIASMPGHRVHRLERSMENPSRYLLVVWWESLEDHTVGFRNSPEYQRWRALLHDFYDHMPEVEHFETVFGIQESAD